MRMEHVYEDPRTKRYRYNVLVYEARLDDEDLRVRIAAVESVRSAGGRERGEHVIAAGGASGGITWRFAR